MTRHVIYILPTQIHNQKNHLWLTYVQCTICTCINAGIYVTLKSLSIFIAKEPDTNENEWPKWSCIRNNFKVADRWLSLTEYSSQDLTIILIFLKVPLKIPAAPDNGKQSRGNKAHIPKIWIMDVYYYLKRLAISCYW